MKWEATDFQAVFGRKASLYALECLIRTPVPWGPRLIQQLAPKVHSHPNPALALDGLLKLASGEIKQRHT